MALLRGLRRRFAGQELTVKLNARLQPTHRHELFEDPLLERLSATGLRVKLDGGGTSVSDDWEPLESEINIVVRTDDIDATVVTSSRRSRASAPRRVVPSSAMTAR